MFRFEELNGSTRLYMLEEYERDMSSNMLYLSTRLTQAGHSEYPKHLRKAIFEGDEQTLAIAISSAHFWNEHE